MRGGGEEGGRAAGGRWESGRQRQRRRRLWAVSAEAARAVAGSISAAELLGGCRAAGGESWRRRRAGLQRTRQLRLHVLHGCWVAGWQCTPREHCNKEQIMASREQGPREGMSEAHGGPVSVPSVRSSAAVSPARPHSIPPLNRPQHSPMRPSMPMAAPPAAPSSGRGGVVTSVPGVPITDQHSVAALEDLDSRLANPGAARRAACSPPPAQLPTAALRTALAHRPAARHHHVRPRAPAGHVRAAARHERHPAGEGETAVGRAAVGRAVVEPAAVVAPAQRLLARLSVS